jgi:formiminotetrahydrofolate cyclodeaminase
MDGDALNASFTGRRLSELLEAVSSPRPEPGAGAVAAVTAAFAAAVAASVSRLSEEAAEDAGEAAARARAASERLILLADANAAAYEEATRSLGRGAEDYEEGRERRLGTDLALAAYTPLSIAEVAAEVAHIAALLADGAEPEVRADAVVAACLAEGAARGAAHLVRINLGMAPGDERAERADEFAAIAAEARERALSTRR